MTKADMLKAGGLMVALQLVAACGAPPPPPDLVAGTLPVGPSAGFTITKTGPDISRRTIAGVVQCLTQSGMAMGGTPAYFIQLGHTVRLAQTMVLLPPDPGASPAKGPVKKVKPVKLKKGFYERLSITVTDLTGKQVFAASVMQLVQDKPQGPSKAAAAAALTDHLCKAIQVPMPK